MARSMVQFQIRRDPIDHWARQHLSPDAEVTSDGLPCFRAIDETFPHCSSATCGAPASVESSEFTWVNTIFLKVKNAIHGTYRSIHSNHFGRYLGTFAYRFNRRFRLDPMTDRLACVACRTAPLPNRFATLAEAHTYSGNSLKERTAVLVEYADLAYGRRSKSHKRIGYGIPFLHFVHSP